MSADVDPEDQTEEPTEKRLHDATERGEVAFSREAPLFASLSATLVALIFVIPGRAQRLLSALIGVIDDPAGWRIERGEDILALADPVSGARPKFRGAEGAPRPLRPRRQGASAASRGTERRLRRRTP
jgi:flagellar biosynthesis protein FlhB